MADSTDKMSAALVAAIRTLVKGPMNFAFGMDGDNAGMLLHRTKSAAALGLQLKQEQKLKKFTFGVATADKRFLVLDVQGTPLSGTEKRMHVFPREHKITTFAEVKVLRGGVEEGEEGAAPTVATAPTVSDEQAAATLAAAKDAWPPEPAPIRHEVTAAENDALAKLPP